MKSTANRGKRSSPSCLLVDGHAARDGECPGHRAVQLRAREGDALVRATDDEHLPARQQRSRMVPLAAIRLPVASCCGSQADCPQGILCAGGFYDSNLSQRNWRVRRHQPARCHGGKSHTKKPCEYSQQCAIGWLARRCVPGSRWRAGDRIEVSPDLAGLDRLTSKRH